MQTNDAKQYWLNPNCFEKTKVRGAFFLFFLPQMSKRRTSAILLVTVSGLAKWLNPKLNRITKLNNTHVTTPKNGVFYFP